MDKTQLRLECLKIALQLSPNAHAEELLNVAMEIEDYVRSAEDEHYARHTMPLEAK